MEYIVFFFVSTIIFYFFGSALKNFLNEALAKYLESGEKLHSENHQFIKNKWPAQIDITKQDVDRLANSLTKRIKKIESSLAELSIKPRDFREHEWIRDEALHLLRQQLTSKLQDQKRDLTLKLKELVNSIPSQVEAWVLKIKPDFRDSTQFVPSMEATQLEKLTHFVKTYGDETLQRQFAENTNLITLFSNALDLENASSIKLIYKLPQNESIAIVPWGGYGRLNAQFNGWRYLIQGWMVKGVKKEAMLDVLSVLEGKLSLTAESFEAKLKIIGNDRLGDRLRSHLFLLLDSKGYIPLLTACDHQKIADWYQKHKADILAAKQLMEAIFNDPNASPIPEACVLERQFHLLDSAVLISDIQSEYSFQNLARHFFETYEGEHPSAHIFLRFIKEDSQERITLTKSVLTKRLTWLIRVACCGILFEAHTLNQTDISLFNDDRVHVDKEAYKFVDEVLRQQPMYKEYKPAFAHFLKVFSGFGLCSAQLQKEYNKVSHPIGVDCCAGI